MLTFALSFSTESQTGYEANHPSFDPSSSYPSRPKPDPPTYTVKTKPSSYLPPNEPIQPALPAYRPSEPLRKQKRPNRLPLEPRPSIKPNRKERIPKPVRKSPKPEADSKVIYEVPYNIRDDKTSYGAEPDNFKYSRPKRRRPTKIKKSIKKTKYSRPTPKSTYNPPMPSPYPPPETTLDEYSAPLPNLDTYGAPDPGYSPPSDEPEFSSYPSGYEPFDDTSYSDFDSINNYNGTEDLLAPDPHSYQDDVYQFQAPSPTPYVEVEDGADYKIEDPEPTPGEIYYKPLPSDPPRPSPIAPTYANEIDDGIHYDFTTPKPTKSFQGYRNSKPKPGKLIFFFFLQITTFLIQFYFFSVKGYKSPSKQEDIFLNEIPTTQNSPSGFTIYEVHPENSDEIIYEYTNPEFDEPPSYKPTPTPKYQTTPKAKIEKPKSIYRPPPLPSYPKKPKPSKKYQPSPKPTPTPSSTYPPPTRTPYRKPTPNTYPADFDKDPYAMFAGSSFFNFDFPRYDDPEEHNEVDHVILHPLPKNANPFPSLIKPSPPKPSEPFYPPPDTSGGTVEYVDEGNLHGVGSSFRKPGGTKLLDQPYALTPVVVHTVSVPVIQNSGGYPTPAPLIIPSPTPNRVTVVKRQRYKFPLRTNPFTRSPPESQRPSRQTEPNPNVYIKPLSEPNSPPPSLTPKVIEHAAPSEHRDLGHHSGSWASTNKVPSSSPIVLQNGIGPLPFDDIQLNSKPTSSVINSFGEHSDFLGASPNSTMDQLPVPSLPPKKAIRTTKQPIRSQPSYPGLRTTFKPKKEPSKKPTKYQPEQFDSPIYYKPVDRLDSEVSPSKVKVTRSPSKKRQKLQKKNLTSRKDLSDFFPPPPDFNTPDIWELFESEWGQKLSPER